VDTESVVVSGVAISLDFGALEGDVSLGRVVVWISYTGTKHICSTWMRHLGGYLLMEGNVAAPWLAATGCVVPGAQEQKPSTKPWMQRQKERDNTVFDSCICIVFTTSCCRLLRFIVLRKLACDPLQANRDVDSQLLACEKAMRQFYLGRAALLIYLIMREYPPEPSTWPCIASEQG
jgi:hypothetical protein